MNSVSLFTDVSLNPKLRVGMSAYLVVPTSLLAISADRIESSKVTDLLMMRRFKCTSSTRLEVQTVLWALEDYQKESKGARLEKLHIYSDSQCVAGLLRRRSLLEAKGFLSAKTNRLLKNAPLYQAFYEAYDQLGFKVIKVTGHSRSCSHDTVDRIFSCIDRGVRKALRDWMQQHRFKTSVNPH